MKNKDFIEQDILDEILQKKLIVHKHLKQNDELLEELELFNDGNLEEFLEKCFEFKK